MPVRLLEDNEIRTRFRELREKYGSQKRVADALGVAQPTISEWETETVPPIERRAELAELVGEPVTYLLVYDDGAPLDRNEYAVRLQVIGKIADGKIDEEALQALVANPRSEAPEDLNELLETTASTRKRTEEGGPGKKQGSGSGTEKK